MKKAEDARKRPGIQDGSEAQKSPLFWQVLGCCGPGKLSKKGKSQKWLAEGAKGPFDSFWAQGAKVSQESFAPPKPSFATPFRTSARGLLLAGSKRPLIFAPSPNHFRERSLFGQFPTSAASQGKFLRGGVDLCRSPFQNAPKEQRCQTRNHSKKLSSKTLFGESIPLNSVHTGGIAKTSGFTRGVCKNR